MWELALLWRSSRSPPPASARLDGGSWWLGEELSWWGGLVGGRGGPRPGAGTVPAPGPQLQKSFRGGLRGVPRPPWADWLHVRPQIKSMTSAAAPSSPGPVAVSAPLPAPSCPSLVKWGTTEDQGERQAIRGPQGCAPSLGSVQREHHIPRKRLWGARRPPAPGRRPPQWAPRAGCEASLEPWAGGGSLSWAF